MATGNELYEVTSQSATHLELTPSCDTDTVFVHPYPAPFSTHYKLPRGVFCCTARKTEGVNPCVRSTCRCRPCCLPLDSGRGRRSSLAGFQASSRRAAAGAAWDHGSCALRLGARLLLAGRVAAGHRRCAGVFLAGTSSATATRVVRGAAVCLYSLRGYMWRAAWSCCWAGAVTGIELNSMASSDTTKS